jgi:flagellar assembly protein FliH
MSGIIPKEDLAEFRRWHIGGFNDQPAPEEPAPAASLEASTPIQPEEETVSLPALPTAEEIEQIHESARAAGYQAGYEEGRLAGEKAGEARASATIENFATLVSNFRQSLVGLEQTVAEQLLSLGIEIASQVIRSAIRTDEQVLLPVIREAIATLPLHHAHITIHLHPDDAINVRARLGEQFATSGGQIVEDTEITPGGCRVQAGVSEVDATVETRWKRVLEAIGTAPGEWLK